MEQTLSIIKPDGVRRNVVGKIFSKIEAAGLKIASTKMVHLSTAQAKQFYAVHAQRPFYGELVDMMCAAPVIVSVLEGDNAVTKYREIMGATDPKKAAPGTIRADLAVSMGENTVHGSDSPENAKIEVNFFFASSEIFNSSSHK